MSFSLIVSTESTGSTTGGTSTAVDTTGADLIVISASTYESLGGTISDNKSNTWTALTRYYRLNNGAVRLYYCVSPTVGTGHTFTVSGTCYGSVSVAAFSGVKTSDAFEVQSGSNGAGTSANPGSITPANDGALLVFGNSLNSATGYLSSLSVGEVLQYLLAGGTWYGNAIGYYVQSTSAAIDPTFNFSASSEYAVTVAAFNPESTGGVTTLYEVAYPSALAAPSGPQIAAGNNVNDTTASWAGNAAWTGAGQYIDATGLDASTSYKASAVVSDGVDYSNVVTSDAWSTLSANIDAAAGSGSIAVTGSAANAVRSLLTDAAAGSVAVTGSAANAVRSLRTDAAAGSVAVTGSAANAVRSLLTDAAAGSVAVTGSAASGVYESAGDTPANAEAGSVAITGSAANAVRTLFTDAAAGSIAITGSTADAVEEKAHDFPSTADAGSILITGSAANGVYETAGNTNAFADAGSIAVTGSAALGSHDYLADAASGTIVLTGASADAVRGLGSVAESGSITVTGSDTQVSRTWMSAASFGSIVLTGVNASGIKRAATWETPLTDEMLTAPFIRGVPVEVFVRESASSTWVRHH